MTKTFGIIANPDKYSVKNALLKVINWSISNRQHIVLTPKLEPLYSNQSNSIRVVSTEQDVIDQSDIVISIGGDGTMLWTAQLMTYVDSKPILGINSGRLGFLANTPFLEIEATLKPASSKMAVIRETVVDFPLVPVTPITFSFLEGKR